VSEQFRRDEMTARLEAILFAAEEPMSARRLAKLLGLVSDADATKLVMQLLEAMRQDGSAFEPQAVGDGFQMTTRPELAEALQSWLSAQESPLPSEATLKTLAVVAHRQPVTRADVDVIRGAPSAEILRNLVDAGWVQVVGQEDSLGRPCLYGTTRKFLQEFGLRNLGELPSVEWLSRPQGDLSTAKNSSSESDVEE
jgi:segregation and condensation protein B